MAAHGLTAAAVEGAKAAETAAGDAEGAVAGGKAVEAAAAMPAIGATWRSLAVVGLAWRLLAAPLFAGNKPIMFVQHPGGANQRQPTAEECQIDR